MKRILGDISRSDLPAKDYFSEYMRQKYRCNCRPNTLRQATLGRGSIQPELRRH
ncbi:MAG: hypothetical protein JRF31_01165 [Deltaproteobacteria bacterium]|nr:hypothetical protein [Deltaproteobacteria bacterium]